MLGEHLADAGDRVGEAVLDGAEADPKVRRHPEALARREEHARGCGVDAERACVVTGVQPRELGQPAGRADSAEQFVVLADQGVERREVPLGDGLSPGEDPVSGTDRGRSQRFVDR